MQYEDCVKDCDQAVEKGRSLHADYKLIAKALTRKGTAFVKMAKTSKDYEPAIEAFNKALTEHRNPDTLKKLNDAERTKKELEQQECFDPAAADIEREKGKKFLLLLCMHVNTVFALQIHFIGVNCEDSDLLVLIVSLSYVSRK